jgi:protein TonB
MHIGDSHVQKPVVIYQPVPQFSEQAKKKKYSGHVVVYLWVDKDGNPTHARVVKSAGMGLDEKAVEAVRQYEFKPATFMGQPVTVDLYVDVNFQILAK